MPDAQPTPIRSSTPCTDDPSKRSVARRWAYDEIRRCPPVRAPTRQDAGARGVGSRLGAAAMAYGTMATTTHEQDYDSELAAPLVVGPAEARGEASIRRFLPRTLVATNGP